MSFLIDFPTKVLVGEDACLQTGEQLKALNVKKVLCVYDQGIKAVGIAGKIIERIKAEGITVVEFDKILSDPPDSLVNEAGALGRQEEVDAILGIGGGSSLDSAKAANILMANEGPISKYFFNPAPQLPGKTLVLIPTTAGTGAEVSSIAVISNSATGEKMAVMGPNCAAKLAIVDPKLTVGLPIRLSVTTGVDTLAHNIEAYTSGSRNPMSDILALEGMALTFKYLPQVVKDGANIEARSGMSFACTLGSMAMGQAMLHLGHGIGTPFGARFHLPHGTACGVWLAGVVEYLAGVLPERVRKIGEVYGLTIPQDISPSELGQLVGGALRDFLKTVGMPTLRDLGITEADLPVIAQDASVDFCMGLGPVRPTLEELSELVGKVYHT